VHALVGENGAGKTTLMKILYGLHRPDAGTISVDDTPISIRGPVMPSGTASAWSTSISCSFPPSPCWRTSSSVRSPRRRASWPSARQRKEIQSLMGENGISLDLDSRVEDLPVGLQQRVEILKILFRGARILIFDEPTAVLTPQESDELFRTFNALKSHGKGIIFITHKLDEVLAVADRITVIRQERSSGPWIVPARQSR